MAETVAGRAPQAYFDTPERSERLQLVAHLVRNADAIPYIRGPKGSGKSRFAERLATIFRQETHLVELAGADRRNVQEAVSQALGSRQEDRPATDVVANAADAGLLVMVDDVDHLDAGGLRALETLRGQGVRLVFLGCSDPATLPGNWNIQLIDLPPLGERQLRDFLDFLGHPDAVLLKDADLARLHRSCQGQPGAVIAALANGRVKHGGPALTGQLPWRWLATGLGVLLVLLVLWQQERINALFVPPGDQVASQSEASALTIPAAAPIQPLGETVMPAETPPALQVAAQHAAGDDGTAAVDAPEMAQVSAAGGAASEAEVGAEPDAGDAGVATPAAGAAGAPETPAEPEAGKDSLEPAAVTEQPVTAGEQALPEQVVGVATPDALPQAHSGLLDMAWLSERQPAAYTLQLAGARDRASLEALVARHSLSGKCLVFERELKEKPWYSLVCGDYPDRAAALHARASLPRSLHQAWPRSFESIRQQLPR